MRLCVEDLCVTYPDGTRALEKLSLTVADGESVALIGGNGAGKTSLIMALAGVIPSTGSVRVGDILLGKTTLRAVRAQVGVLFQDPDDQLFMPTVYDDVAFGLRNAGVPEAEIPARVTECLTRLGVVHLQGRTALRLSGGEKRMAALATVLVMEPSLMLLDEPSAFLDPRARRELIRQLKLLPHAKLIATHDLAFAYETCTRVVLLQGGRVFADGPASLLFDGPLMQAGGVEAINAYEGRERA